MQRLRIIVFGLICACSFLSVQAQEYLYEFGVGAGISSAYGDLNQNQFFYDPSFMVEGLFRYNYNPRWAFFGELSSLGLKGKSTDFSNRFPNATTYQFDNRLWQIGGGAEFNFFNYGSGAAYQNLKRISPFLLVGANLGFVTGGTKNAFSFSIPFGIGCKYKISSRWSCAARLIFSKSFSDEMDNIKDPYAIESSTIKNTDWYSVIDMSISYSFGHRKRICNNLD